MIFFVFLFPGLPVYSPAKKLLSLQVPSSLDLQLWPDDSWLLPAVQPSSGRRTRYFKGAQDVSKADVLDGYKQVA